MNNQEKALIFEQFIKRYNFYRVKLFEVNYIYRNFFHKKPLIHNDCVFSVKANEYTFLLQFHKHFHVGVSQEDKNYRDFYVYKNKNLMKFANILYKTSGKHVSRNELLALFDKIG